MSAECSAGNITPGYKQTEVGVIPEDWSAKTLGDIITHCFSGATPSRSRPDFLKEIYDGLQVVSLITTLLLILLRR